MNDLILSIDQGTTSTRAIVFDSSANILASSQQEFQQHFPQTGWVEHDPEDIWSTTQSVCEQVISKTGEISSIGITNQRETVVIWDRISGQPIHKAIVWQDTRTTELCEQLKSQGLEIEVTQKTGLLLNPYFSATKISWILDHVEGARDLANKGKLACGTMDSFLIWRLTGGSVHATDASNASRTLLYNIHTQSWDDELLELFNIPLNMLPEVQDSASFFGLSSKDAIGVEIPICGVAGDQQAASIGQCCFDSGDIKMTFGTGGFAMLNTGDKPIYSQHGMLTTVASRLNGHTRYSLEGSIFIAGAAVQWLRDRLNIIDTASDTENFAKGLKNNGGVYLVPAFVGLGTPYWNPNARGAIFGLTRDTGPEHFARAALESVCYQTFDLVNAMQKDTGQILKSLKIDGGMASNDWMCQMLADILNIEIKLPVIAETTALGAAYLAGLHTGTFSSQQALTEMWLQDKSFKPDMDENIRSNLIAGWERAINSVNQMSK